MPEVSPRPDDAVHARPDDSPVIAVSIAESVLEAFPMTRVAALRVRDLRAVSAALPPVADLMRRARTRLGAEIGSVQDLVDDPRIAAWRRAVADCGLKPSRFKSSAEQLARTLLKERDIVTPRPIVNAYCAISAANLAPLGAHDVAGLSRPELVLRHARADDSFSPLSGRPGDLPLSDKVVVYATGQEISCWCFNHKDSSRFCLLQETDEAIFVGEAVARVQHAALQSAMSELASLLSDAGGRPGAVSYADADKPAFRLA